MWAKTYVEQALGAFASTHVSADSRWMADGVFITPTGGATSILGLV